MNRQSSPHIRYPQVGVDSALNRGKPPGPEWFPPWRLDEGARRLFILACVLGALALIVNVKVIFDLGAESVREAIVAEIQAARNAGIEAASFNLSVFGTLVTGRTHLMVLLVLNLACFGSFLYLIVRRVMKPLDVIAKGAREISEGNLNIGMPLEPSRDPAGLGETITDIAVNYQEVLLYTGTTVGDCKNLVDEIERMLRRNEGDLDAPEIEEYLETIRAELDSLSEMVSDFRYYGTFFDGREVSRDRSLKDE